MNTVKRTSFVFFVMVLLCSPITMAREKININLGWKYQSGSIEQAQDVHFNDKDWQVVNLPHDAQVVGPFVKKGNGASNRNGYRPLGRGWYRKKLQYDKAWQGKHVVLEFEGVYRDAKVYVNGKQCEGDYPNGYLDFEFDITDKLQQGENVIAVSYDNSYPKSSRWYNGEGINRDVWLHVLDDVHVARYGTFVTTPKITPSYAKVTVKTAIKNERTDSVLCRLITEIIAPDGKTVATAEAVAPFAGGETYQFNQNIIVKNPQLWNVGDGKMYRAISHVYVQKEIYNGHVRKPLEWASNAVQTSLEKAFVDIPSDAIDTYETPFGIREIEMTPNEGLLVNGKRVYVNGVCLHTDLGPLGMASFEEGWNQRLSAITEKLGCNGIRLSHNAYPKYVLDWADRHGVLVVDEFFDKWDESYYGKGAKFGDLHLRDLRTQMQRDRNHPSVFIWSVGNEVYQQIQDEQTRTKGIKQLKTLLAEAHQMDPSRLATCSQYPNRYKSVTRKRNEKRFLQSDPHPFEFYTDVVCTNYLENFWDEDHKRFPQLVFMEGEMSVGDLGYAYYNFDHSYPVGQFYWGGTDYIGESFGWPSKGWVRGLVSFTNHLKPLGWSVRSFYNTEKPMVKIITRPDKGQGGLVWNDLKMTWIALDEHWNYVDGDKLKVQVMSNCDETELFLNGKSLGRKQLPPKNQAPELVWEVAYQKGELKAIGYKNGVKVSEDVLATAGKPAKILVDVSKSQLKGDGMDLAYLDYTVVDAQGNVCLDAVKLDFEVKGQGTNVGVANDDMMSDEPWKGNSRSTYRGKCQLIVRSSALVAGKAGKILVKAKAKGLKTLAAEIIVK